MYSGVPTSSLFDLPGCMVPATPKSRSLMSAWPSAWVVMKMLSGFTSR